ncbi:MAG: hypothetical protein ICV63_01080 [Coleofasciculus sp. Co-bin14]|nr:hypothetical protein [Coleofasciculus sp. Co-bin14]
MQFSPESPINTGEGVRRMESHRPEEAGDRCTFLTDSIGHPAMFVDKVSEHLRMGVEQFSAAWTNWGEGASR